MRDPFETMQSSIDRAEWELGYKRALLANARRVTDALRAVGCNASPLPDFEAKRVDWRTQTVRLSIGVQIGDASDTGVLQWIAPDVTGRSVLAALVPLDETFALPDVVINALRREQR